MTEKNDFSFSSNCYQSLTPGKCLTRAHFHVAGGITCPTAYILDPRVKGHPKKIFSKIKNNKQKKLFFSKKNRAHSLVTLFGSRPTAMNWTSPDLYINPEKKISKKTWKMTEKNDFSSFSNSFQSVTLGKCLTRAQPHVARGITCPTAYILHPRVKGHPKKIFKKIKKNNQKNLVFSKKNSCRTACYAVQIAPNRHELNVPRPLHQPWKKMYRKKIEKWPKKMIFLFSPTKMPNSMLQVE